MIREYITLLRANQIAGNTTDFKMDTIDAAKMFTRRTEDPLKENGVSTSNKGQALKISQTFLFVPFKHFKLLFALSTYQ